MSNAERLIRPFDEGAVELPDAGTITYLRAEPGAMLDMLPQDRLRLVQSFRPIAERLEAVGARVETDPFAPDAPPAQLTLVNLTRHRAEAKALIAAAWRMTGPDGVIIISGNKTDGVDAILKRLKQEITLAGVMAKSHGKVAWLRRDNTMPTAFDDWIAAIAFTQNAAGYQTSPGMFSSDDIDPGSALLAEHLPTKLGARIADLGAGWGWLSAALLQKDSKLTEMVLFEAEARALDAARRNITDPRAAFHWEDVTALKRGIPFDTVITNPPFHESRSADPALGVSFIRTAQRILKPSGTLWLVANRHLPYEPALNAAFHRVEKRAETARFKVYQAGKPKRV